MPDLTLYREDIELIRNELYRASKRSIKTALLRDKLLDRLTQNLHPSKEQVEGRRRFFDTGEVLTQLELEKELK